MKESKNTRLPQYLVTVISSLAIAAVSVNYDWCSPALLYLTNDKSYAGIQLTPKETSWVAASVLFGNTLGSIPAAWLMDKIGRRKSALLGGIIMFLSWIALMLTANLWVMLVFRFVAGIGSAIPLTVGPVYVGEIAHKSIRGKLTMINMFASTLASVLILSVGPFVSYIALNCLCACFPLVFTCAFFFVPESPYYLVKVCKYEEAKVSLRRLQSKSTSVEELDELFREIKETVENSKSRATFKELFLVPNYRKSLGLLIGLRTLQQLSLITVMNLYVQTIVDMANVNLSTNWVSVIYGVMKLPSGLLAAFVVDRLGRKPLLILSSLGSSVSLAALGTFFYLSEKTDVNLVNVNYVLIIIVLFYIVSASVGVFPLPFVMFGELMATEVKSVGGLIFTFYGSILSFLVTKMFIPAVQAFGTYTVFWFFGASCFLGIPYTWFSIPETKNKSFAEVQRKLGGTNLTNVQVSHGIKG